MILAAIIVFMQAAVLCVILFGALRLARAAREKTAELSTTVVPVLNHTRDLLKSTHELVTRLEPRFEAAAADLAGITGVAHAQAVRIDSTANDIHDRVHRQTVRLDGMASNVLDSVDYASRKVGDAVRRPARRIAGAIAAVSAFVESLTRPAPHRQPAPPEPIHEDKDVPV